MVTVSMERSGVQAETPQDASAAGRAVRLMEATEVRAQKAAKQARLDF